jgi:hypothetical protein
MEILLSNMSSAMEAKDFDVENIWVSDEVHFWLNGYVNKQNYRFWGKEQPFITQSKPLHPDHLPVWAAMSTHSIHFFLKEL